MADFNIAVDITIRNEGGYVNDPNDPGGETKYGISKRAFPKLDIANLSLEQAKTVYKINYWKPVIYNQIASQAVANKLFDMGVNMGVGTAIRLLQEAAGVTPDGIFGLKTLAAVNSADAAVLLSRYVELLSDRYRSIAAARPSDGEFLGGWLRRVEA